MKNVAYTLLVVMSAFSLSFAEGPLFKQPDSSVQQEFENVYQDMRKLQLKTGPSYFGNGSEGAPSYSFSASTTSGMYLTGAGIPYSLRFSVNGSNKLSAVAAGVEVSSGTLTLIGGTISNSAGNVSWATTSAGEITQPLQPSFLEHLNSAQSNVTGDNTVITVQYNNEIYDQGSDFANSTFTAPVAGRYLFAANIKMEGIATTHASIDGYIVTSNRTYIVTFSLPGVAAVTEYSVPISVIADMDSGDTAYVQVAVNGTGKTADISGAASVRNFFSGSLLN